MSKAATYKQVKKQFKQNGGAVVYGYFAGLEVTAAAIRDGNFYKIATALCSCKDEFNPKKGKRIAVERLMRGESMPVPVRAGYTTFCYGTINMDRICEAINKAAEALRD